MEASDHKKLQNRQLLKFQSACLSTHFLVISKVFKTKKTFVSVFGVTLDERIVYKGTFPGLYWKFFHLQIDRYSLLNTGSYLVPTVGPK